MAKYMTYEQSGVSIDANDQMVNQIRSAVKSTYGPRVIDTHNAFAGLFRLDYDEKIFKKNYRNPVLVACTDGVGTKIKLAQMAKRYDTIGIDLVAMSVNDMLTQGAEPLFFLDYIAIDNLHPEKIAEMVEGIAKGCRKADCALIGGETAEMPDVYPKDEFDMAGFAVGVVEKHKLIKAENLTPGDVILGLASDGIHSNGYTLVRDICFNKNKLHFSDQIDMLDGQLLGEALLRPTRIYVRPIVKLLNSYKKKKIVKAMAHITGGGLPGNIPRVIGKNLNAEIKKSAWPIPPVFKFLQKTGPVKENEMYRVFNMGIGFILIVPPAFADSVTQKLQKQGEKVYQIGKIKKGKGSVIIK